MADQSAVDFIRDFSGNDWVLSAASASIGVCTDPAELDRIDRYTASIGLGTQVRDAISQKRNELGQSGVNHWAPTEGEGQ